MIPCPEAGPARAVEVGAAPPAPMPASGPRPLAALFRCYRGRLLLTYALFNLENLARLAQPYLLGLAINDLLRGEFRGLALFAGQHLLFVLLTVARRAYDARAFSGIYADLAAGLVLGQRRQQVEVSRVAARSALSRELVDFFERDVPALVFAVYSVGGALALLLWLDGLLVLFCLGLLLPLCLLNAAYSQKALTLNRRLNDELEREVEVIATAREAEVQGHYRRLGHWRVRLADCEAFNFGLMELCVLGLMAAALVRACRDAGAEPGTILAVFRYVIVFVAGLDQVPGLVRQVSRLRDVGRRLRGDSPSGPE